MNYTKILFYAFSVLCFIQVSLQAEKRAPDALAEALERLSITESSGLGELEKAITELRISSSNDDFRAHIGEMHRQLSTTLRTHPMSRNFDAMVKVGIKARDLLRTSFTLEDIDTFIQQEYPTLSPDYVRPFVFMHLKIVIFDRVLSTDILNADTAQALLKHTEQVDGRRKRERD